MFSWDWNGCVLSYPIIFVRSTFCLADYLTFLFIVLTRLQRPDCPDYAMFLLAPTPGHDHFARHFALQGLSAAVARCGNDPGPAGEALRAAAASLLTSPGYVQPLGTEVGHVKEAVCRLVSDLAERSFPQQWPGFMEGVLSAWQNSTDGTAAELAMMVLRNVAEDCTDAQFNSRLSTGRRNDVLRGLRAHVPTLLALTYAYMSHQFQQACAAQTAAAGADGSTDSPAACLLRASLNMVKRFHLWIRPEELLADDHDFTQVCVFDVNPERLRGCCSVFFLSGAMLFQVFLGCGVFTAFFFDAVKLNSLIL